MQVPLTQFAAAVSLRSSAADKTMGSMCLHHCGAVARSCSSVPSCPVLSSFVPLSTTPGQAQPRAGLTKPWHKGRHSQTPVSPQRAGALRHLLLCSSAPEDPTGWENCSVGQVSPTTHRTATLGTINSYCDTSWQRCQHIPTLKSSKYSINRVGV